VEIPVRAMPIAAPAFLASAAILSIRFDVSRSAFSMPCTRPPVLATTSTVSVPRFRAAILCCLCLMRHVGQQGDNVLRGCDLFRLFRPDSEVAWSHVL